MSQQLKFIEENRLKGLPWYVGACVCAVLITKDYVYCANAGDTRACIAKKKGPDGKHEII